MTNNIENFSQMFQNPQAWALKKYAFDILKERYAKNEEILSRITSNLTTKRDAEAFGTLIADLFEIGYLKATEQHKELAKGLGFNVKIVSPPKETTKIFQDEKSG